MISSVVLGVWYPFFPAQFIEKTALSWVYVLDSFLVS